MEKSTSAAPRARSLLLEPSHRQDDHDDDDVSNGQSLVASRDELSKHQLTVDKNTIEGIANMFYRCFAFMMLVAVASMALGPVDAFQSTHIPSSLATTSTKGEASSFALHAFKPPSLKKKTAEPPSEKIKSSNALDLIILYMTPWRNPNSIFVYLFVILFALGKYSEAQSAAGSM